MNGTIVTVTGREEGLVPALSCCLEVERGGDKSLFPTTNVLKEFLKRKWENHR